jgi:hypothetical protein
MKLTIGSTSFISKAKAKETIKNLIYETGVCREVGHQILYDLIKKHYDYENKTKNMVSLGIEECDHGLRLVIHNENSTTEISWHCCFDGPKSHKTLMTNALRTCINSQIWEYRCNNFPSLCHMCDNEAEEVDHIYRFEHIRDDFLKTYNGKQPEHFTKVPRTFRTAFIEGEPMMTQFQDYHKKVATYRPLCRSCNVGLNKLSLDLKITQQ